MGNFSSVDYFYLVCAIIGSLLFLLRLGLSFFGGEAGNVDTDMVSEVAHLDSADAHHIGDPGFQLFSLQGITGFFIMFGLVGLALSRAGGQIVWTAVGGIAAGGVTMVVIAGHCLLYPALAVRRHAAHGEYGWERRDRLFDDPGKRHGADQRGGSRRLAPV